MTTQWYLSKNGKVTGPSSLIDSQKFVADNENVYVWKANFAQWQAASQVAEFADFVKTSEILPVVPKGLVEKFAVKKKRVYSKLLTCTDKFSQSEKALEELLEKIETYKKVTVNLSPAVQGAIASTEKRYHVLANKVSTLEAVVKNAEAELISVSNDFENKNEVTSEAATTKALKGLNDDAPKQEAPIEEISAESIEVVSEETPSAEADEESIAQAMKNAEEEFLAKFGSDDSSDDGAEEFLNAETSDATEAANLSVETPEVVSDTTEKESAMHDIKNIFSGTKDAAILAGKGFKGANKLIKSVFTPIEETESVPLSKQLNQLPKEETNEVAEAAKPVEEAEELALEHSSPAEDESNIKRRRRR